MNKKNNFRGEFELTTEQMTAFLEQFPEQNLAEHYMFTESIKSNVQNVQQVKVFIKENKPITFTLSEGEIFYSINDQEASREIFTVDTSTSFEASNTWLYDKLVLPAKIFPNIATTNVSSEQAAFFVCITIAMCLQGEFKEEFLEEIETYDFNNWSQGSDEHLSFVSLLTDWIQMGSELVKMVAAAARFTLARSVKKNSFQSLIDVDSEMASKFRNLNRSIESTRYEYDVVKLAPEVASKLTKLQRKVIIAERDEKIKFLIESNPELHKLWRIYNLNSNVIDPSIRRSYIRKARKSAKIFYEEINGVKPDKKVPGVLQELKVIEDKLKREAIRATINKMKVSEMEEFKKDPDGYNPPTFV